MTDEKPPRHPGGRPRIDPRQRSYSVHVSLPHTTYDQAYRVAKAHGMTVPELIRRVYLRRPLPEKG